MTSHDSSTQLSARSHPSNPINNVIARIWYSYFVLESQWLPTKTGINLTKRKTRNYKTIRSAHSFCLPGATNPQFHQSQYFEKSHDVILFAIDCSRSMLALHDDANFEDAKTSHLLSALNAAVQIQKRKVIVGPYDSVGIMFYNTVRFSRSYHSLYS
jgi:hypothetical protein